MYKRIFDVMILLSIAINLMSQPANLNPDPNGQPWLVYQDKTLSEEEKTYILSLPQLTLPESYNAGRDDLPDFVDNSLSEHFRPIFEQVGNSCGQASGTGYAFTYEINRKRNLSAESIENQYPTHYTWNFLNNGQNSGSNYWDGWNIIKDNGCPNLTTWGGTIDFGGQTRWMSGYDDYYNAMKNRIDEVYCLDVSTELGLRTFKHWMHDHLDGSENGGVACFMAGITDYHRDFLPEGTPEAGKYVILEWNPAPDHEMTLVGYNDSIRYDVNNDGQYTNHLDINDDGIVNIIDWEIGGVIVVNSWGDDWCDGGKSYLLYRNLAQHHFLGGLYLNRVMMIDAKEDYEPLLTIKTTIKHTQRGRLKISAGIAADLNADEPEHYLDFHCFNYQGGEHYMQGGSEEEDKSIEIGLDVTPLLAHMDEREQDLKIFLVIDEYDGGDEADGEVISMSVINYIEEEAEVVCEEANVEIINHSTTYLSITANINYSPVSVTTETLPDADNGQYYSQLLSADSGAEPYKWSLKTDYMDEEINFDPTDTDNELVFPNNEFSYTMLPLDFTFPFFGDFYDTVYVTTNGFITFGKGYEFIGNQQKLLMNKAITPFGAGMTIQSDGAGAWYSHYEDYTAIRFKLCGFYSPGDFIDATVNLYRDGRIEFHYSEVPDWVEYEPWTAGISNGDEINYFIPDFVDPPSLNSNTAIAIHCPLLPARLYLSQDGIISGMPDAEPGEHSFTVCVRDNHNMISEKEISLNILPLSIENENKMLQPKTISKLYNRPNPFNPTTAISFELGSKGKVELSVYNIKGQLVTTLLSSEMEAGSHTVVWDGSSGSGEMVSSGIYFCRLNVGSETTTEKMLLLK